MELSLPLYQIDAFSDRPFGGNPAAVVPLQSWLPDHLLQAIAAENNLSETAFFVVDAPSPRRLRWFTPTNEVDLCGHATLAAAWVLFEHHAPHDSQLDFICQSGPLCVRRHGPRLQLDFPARVATPVNMAPSILSALRIADAHAMLQARDLIVVLDSAEQVAAVTPDFTALAQHDVFAVCITAPGDDCDFVSRFFAPRQGINEDPVTGSAHCSLVPYWQQRLQRNRLHARQISARGGELFCQLDQDRVLISGDACCYLRGEIRLPLALTT